MASTLEGYVVEARRMPWAVDASKSSTTQECIRSIVLSNPALQQTAEMEVEGRGSAVDDKVETIVASILADVSELEYLYFRMIDQREQELAEDEEDDGTAKRSDQDAEKYVPDLAMWFDERGAMVGLGGITSAPGGKQGFFRMLVPG